MPSSRFAAFARSFTADGGTPGTPCATSRGSESDRQNNEDNRHLSEVGTPGTPGTPEIPNAREIDALDGLRQAALRRPVSWADPTARPSAGCFCSCCKGHRWWCEREAPKGWRCWQCHPPDGAPVGSITEVRS